MNARPAREPAPSAAGRTRLVGAALLAALVAVIWVQPRWTSALQSGWFDTLQSLSPRHADSFPVTIVDVDQRSLAALGQWPWPRTILARLLRDIERAGPAAIGIDILMPEADALSPERVLAATPIDAAAAAALRALPSNDAVLAQAIGETGAVLAVAGAPEATGMALRAAPVMVRSASGDAALASVPRYAGALGSIEELNRRAAGWGLVSVDASGGIVRRVPMVASIDGTLVPTLALELLRVAAGVNALRLTAAGGGVAAVAIGDLTIPTEPDGNLRLYFSAHAPERFVPALDVLQGRADPSLFERRLVLIGITGIGLHEYLDTPLGERMSGVEIQAQLLENMIDGTWLRRPAWAAGAEAVALLLAGALLIWATPRSRPFSAVVSLLGLVLLLLAAAALLFLAQRLLLDAATPGVGLVLLFGLLLTLTLADANRQRRLLERTVQAQREQAARVAGELEAAQRIQNAMLPRRDLLSGDDRIDLAALLTPAREVGGDLYDYFRLDQRRLFFLIGDVAGKGLSASIFMAVSKALYKSVTLRTPLVSPGGDVGRVMSLANTEVSRDNGQMLFVTAFAGVLDLDSGELAYCNAGHDNPYRLTPGRQALARIVDGDGPPLASVPDFPYAGGRCRLAPGEMLCLMSDGASEAQNAAGELFGAHRVEKVLLGLPATASAADAVAALQAEVLSFAGGTAEPADDLTILALRWMGPMQGRG